VNLKNKEEYKELYYWFKEKKICVRCKSQKARPNKILCFDCADKQSKIDKNRYSKYTPIQKEEFKKKVQYNFFKRYHKRRDNRQCVKCGKNLTVKYKNNIWCTECRIKEINKVHKKCYPNGYLSKHEWGSFGLCSICGKRPFINGKKLCQACYDKVVKNLQGIDNKNHWWRKDNDIAFQKKIK